jgi:hypothetical protein
MFIERESVVLEKQGKVIAEGAYNREETVAYCVFRAIVTYKLYQKCTAIYFHIFKNSFKI